MNDFLLELFLLNKTPTGILQPFPDVAEPFDSLKLVFFLFSAHDFIAKRKKFANDEQLTTKN